MQCMLQERVVTLLFHVKEQELPESSEALELDAFGDEHIRRAQFSKEGQALNFCFNALAHLDIEQGNQVRIIRG